MLVKKPETGLVVQNQSKKMPFYQKAAIAIGSSLMVVNAHAAELNLSELTTQFEQVKTTVGGVITAAIGVTVLIVGWRWVKRAVFSV